MLSAVGDVVFGVLKYVRVFFQIMVLCTVREMPSCGTIYRRAVD